MIKSWIFLVTEFKKKFPEGSFRNRYLTGTFWMVVGTSIAQASTFITMIVAARVLGSEIYGRFGMIQSTQSLFLLVAAASTGMMNKRWVGENRDRDPNFAGEIIGFSTTIVWISALTLGSFLFIFSPWISEELLKNSGIVLELRIAAILLIFSALNEPQIGTISGLEEFRKIAFINFIRSVITFIFILLGVYLWKLPGMIGGMTIVAAIVWLVSGIYLKHSLNQSKIIITYSNVRKFKNIFLSFNLPNLASGIVPFFTFWVIRAILVQYPNGYIELGIFTAVEQLITIISIIPGQMNNVSQPILSNIYASNKRTQFKKAAISNTVLPVFIAFVLSVLVLLISPILVRIYGPTFTGLTPVLVIMCFVGVLRVFGGSVGVFLVTFNKMWISFGINIIWGIILIGSAYLFAPTGAKGLAYANLLAYGFTTLAGLLILYLLNNSLNKSIYVNETIG